MLMKIDLEKLVKELMKEIVIDSPFVGGLARPYVMDKYFIVYYLIVILLHKVSTSECGIRPMFH